MLTNDNITAANCRIAIEDALTRLCTEQIVVYVALMFRPQQNGMYTTCMSCVHDMVHYCTMYNLV